MYPIIDADGDLVTGLSFSPQISTWTDAIFPSTFLTIEAAAELGSSGWYLSTLSATQTAADYLAFHASPTTGGTKRQHLLFNFTAVASVTEVGTVTNVATVGQVTDTIWNRVLTSSPTTAGAAGLLLQSIYATMSTGPLATVTAVKDHVPLNWASISGQATNVNLQLTKIATVGVAVPINWGSVSNPGVANNLTLTQVASVNNPVPILWSSITSPSATVGLTATTLATVTHVEDLTSTAYPEPAAVPGATATLKNKLNWMEALSRNKITASSVTQVLWDDAGTATISVATHSDAASLLTRNEWS